MIVFCASVHAAITRACFLRCYVVYEILAIKPLEFLGIRWLLSVAEDSVWTIDATLIVPGAHCSQHHGDIVTELPLKC